LSKKSQRCIPINPASKRDSKELDEFLPTNRDAEGIGIYMDL